MSKEKWPLESFLSGCIMDDQTREIVEKITNHITRAECVALGANIFAAEHLVTGSRGKEEGTMCIGTDVFAIFPFEILNDEGDKNYLAVFFTYRPDGSMRLADSVTEFALISENGFEHKYQISDPKRLPRPRVKMYEILSPGQLRSIGINPIVLDFNRAGDDLDRLHDEIREILHGAKTHSEVLARLEGVTVLPAPGKVFSVQGSGDGYDIIFLIGKGERPRAVHCVEEDFDDFR